ncbi:hypothetical protein [Streptomyces sp. NPDC012466]|jgi:hypothetical protein|uniref:hypothetical protein n=1 Tax=Streptomyces sp. NPDC012466 TaxID=3364835 RepID=UPI0036EA7D5F
MGIRTFLSRTAPGAALPRVPAFEAAASTVRVPVPFTTALRHATADLRQRLTACGRRPPGSPGTGGLTAATALPGAADPATALVLGGTEVWSALTGTDDLPSLVGLPGADTLPSGVAAPAALPHGATGTHGAAGTPETPGKPSRPWARLARDYLTLVLTLLPRPRPGHTTITVYITTTDRVLSERPGGSAPSRRPGPDRPGPEPDAAP